MDRENWINGELARLKEEHRFRRVSPLPQAGGRVTIGDRTLINFSSNDYLDFIHRPEIKAATEAAVRAHGAGSGSSRLVTGTLAAHEELEVMLARHKGYPAALLFGSGYLTNLGIVSSLAGRGDHVIADRLVHASLIDAIRLSGAKLVRFHHNRPEHLAQCLDRVDRNGRLLVVTESVFSMDGDLAPLREIARVAADHGAMLLVDEAHASGVFGKAGRGLVAGLSLQADVNLSMCTFSKALGSYGGGVACSEPMREWLINAARSFIYTTALPPSVCAASMAALDILEHEPGLGVELLEQASRFRSRLRDQGFDIGASASQIVPVMVGDNAAALRLATALREHGILVTAIRPPTVPPGTARLRFSITLAHDMDDLDRTVKALAACFDREGLPRTPTPSLPS